MFGVENLNCLWLLMLLSEFTLFVTLVDHDYLSFYILVSYSRVPLHLDKTFSSCHSWILDVSLHLHERKMGFIL